MTKTILVNYKFWLSLLAVFIVLLLGSQVRAQSASPAASPRTSSSPVGSPAGSPAGKPDTAVVFPITELGNCQNKGECLSFCDDPVNFSACVDYAKKKNFYKSDEVVSADDKFWQKTNTQLGCNSKEACLDFCSKSENADKCDSFAKKEQIIGGYVQTADTPDLLKAAKNDLGCDSATGCTSFCDNPANVQKCTNFAHQVGLLGGQITEGPGGCSSQGTCQSFCRDPNNFNACQAYAPPNTPFQGPGGCNSPGGCRSHCEQNPEDCRSYSPGSSGQYVPVVCPAGQYFGPGGACTPTSKTEEASSCAQGGKYWSGQSCQGSPPVGINQTAGGGFFQPRPDMGNCNTPGGCYDYCKSNPDKCAGFRADSQRPPDTYIPNLYYTPGTIVKNEPIKEMGNCTTPGGCYDYCKENPGKCQGFDPKSPRPLDTFVPGIYYTPPRDMVYVTPPATSFYVTPVYYTPPAGLNYTTPTYYTPGLYSTPSYYTPPPGSNYSTPSYYTPGSYYATPQGGYPTPSYQTPSYYTPPAGLNYTTPTYYTPASYTTPNYYTPPPGSTYTTPNYVTPPAYGTPQYYTPYTGGSYTTPVYYTPPPGSNYTTPSYSSPVSYVTPQYYTPPPGSSYTTPATYYSPGSYVSPSYYTPPPGSSYTTPSSYNTPSYSTPGTYNTPPPGGYGYPTPGTSYAYPSPTYGSPSYGTPSYGTPSYSTPSYGTPSYETPSYSTPSYGTPSYETPPPPPPGPPPPPPPP